MKICVLALKRADFDAWLRQQTSYAETDLVCCIRREDLEGQDFQGIVTLNGFWAEESEELRALYAFAHSRVFRGGCSQRDIGTPMDHAWHRKASGRE